MIELKNVSLAYSRGNPVLKGVSARFKSGRLYGIFGPNGCGKSTLLKLITGELAPDTGSISPRWNDPLERACRLAMVEQEIPGRIPLTVREVIALGRYPWMRRRKVSSDIEEILNELQLAPLAEKPYSHLSGGERQRTMLARAVAQDTSILLLDEPASSLDIGFQHEFYRLLRQFARRGKCIVMISHDLFIAPHYLDEALLMKEGAVFAGGTPAQVIRPEKLRAVFRYREPESWEGGWSLLRGSCGLSTFRFPRECCFRCGTIPKIGMRWTPARLRSPAGRMFRHRIYREKTTFPLA